MKPPYAWRSLLTTLPAQETLFSEDGEGHETNGDSVGDVNLPEGKSTNR